MTNIWWETAVGFGQVFMDAFQLAEAQDQLQKALALKGPKVEHQYMVTAGDQTTPLQPHNVFNTFHVGEGVLAVPHVGWPFSETAPTDGLVTAEADPAVLPLKQALTVKFNLPAEMWAGVGFMTEVEKAIKQAMEEQIKAQVEEMENEILYGTSAGKAAQEPVAPIGLLEGVSPASALGSAPSFWDPATTPPAANANARSRRGVAAEPHGPPALPPNRFQAIEWAEVESESA